MAATITRQKAMVEQVASELRLPLQHVESTIKLLEQEKTVPFIVRYRKELTGGLDERQIRKLQHRIDEIKELWERKNSVLQHIQKTHPSALNASLRAKIENAVNIEEVEDLYLPYKPKKPGTLAERAKQLGPSVETLADIIWKSRLERNPSTEMEESFPGLLKNVMKQVNKSREDVKLALKHILAEKLNELPQARQTMRQWITSRGMIHTKFTSDGHKSSKSAKSQSKSTTVKRDATFDQFRQYDDFRKDIRLIAHHQILAIDRAEKLKVVRVSIETPRSSEKAHHSTDLISSKLLPFLTASNGEISGVGKKRFREGEKASILHLNGELYELLQETINDTWKRLLFPAVSRDIRSYLTTKAKEQAADVFALNLRNLLLVPPLRNKTVLGLDPGYRHGCKVVVVDSVGSLLDSATIYPHSPQKKWDLAVETLRGLIQKFKVDVIAIGDGTASRETQELAAEIIDKVGRKDLVFTVVSEAGASVYSTSEAAKEDFPDQTPEVAGAASIARRLQDPLAELVKIDPQHIGVGMYQHDIQSSKLAERLKEVVEDCVNSVGVDANTASPYLLQYVSGLNKRLARTLYQEVHPGGLKISSPFSDRYSIKSRIKGFGPKTFEQSAGFLRIFGGSEPLDSTSIHPESYDIAKQIIHELTSAPHKDVMKDSSSWEKLLAPKIKELLENNAYKEPGGLLKTPLQMLQKRGLGKDTLQDILFALVDSHRRDSRDPQDKRDEFFTGSEALNSNFMFRRKLLTLDDLDEGLKLRGKVTNVVDFGAFVDIGIKENGLLHISQLNSEDSMPNVGDVIETKVVSVDKPRHRVGLALA